jgi:hypothetical protein
MFSGNDVRQLLVPASSFPRISGTDADMQIRNNFGVWPAAAAGSLISDDVLWARLPFGQSPARA